MNATEIMELLKGAHRLWNNDETILGYQAEADCPVCYQGEAGFYYTERNNDWDAVQKLLRLGTLDIDVQSARIIIQVGNELFSVWFTPKWGWGISTLVPEGEAAEDIYRANDSNYTESDIPVGLR